jgi:peptidoglycan/LPS O-acetylase OafA/YrhL
MRSTSGQYFVAIDHLRAVAAYLVFVWHFASIHGGQKVNHPGTEDFLLWSWLTEGHTGVSLFFCISGYLFARLTDGRTIDWPLFYRARVLRLLPLLVLVCLLVIVQDWGIHGTDYVLESLPRYPMGVLLPTLPNGGWSITVEMHFYLVLPVILILWSRSALTPFVILALSMAVRLAASLALSVEELRDLSYYSMAGRIDQFVLGMLFARHGSVLAGKHLKMAIFAAIFLYSFSVFDSLGGHYGTRNPGIFVIWYLWEGLFYSALVSYYVSSFTVPMTGTSRLIAQIGAASYSIYLLHYFFVGNMAIWIDRTILPLDSAFRIVAAASAAFLVMAAIAWLNYTGFERPFLQLRKSYARPGKAT